MSTATIPNIFVANTIIQSASMNANFAYITGLFNTNILPAVGTVNSVVTTDASGNFQASTYASIVNTGSPLTTKGDLQTFSTTTTRLPVGTNGQVLVSDSSQTTGLRWGTNGGAVTSQLQNVGLAASASAGVLTVALKQQDGSTDPSTSNPASIAVRSPTLASGSFNVRAVTAALSQTLAVQTTLGMPASTPRSLYVYALDSDGAGTIKLGLSTFRHDDGKLQSTVLESNVVTATIANPGVITETAHGRLNNDAVQLTTTGALPTGLTAATTYYIIAATTNTYELATSPGGLAIVTSGSQSGVHTIHTASAKIVSGAVYTNVATRMIGRLKFTLATSGTWIAPTDLALSGEFKDTETFGFLVNTNTDIYGTGSSNVVHLTNIARDDLSLYSLIGGNAVVPVSGIYTISGGVASQAIAAGTTNEVFAAQILVNNSTVVIGQFTVSQSTASVQYTAQSALSFVRLNANDIIQLNVQHSLGSNVTLSGNAPVNYLALSYVGMD